MRRFFWCWHFAVIYMFLVSISCLMYSCKDFMSFCGQFLYFVVKKLFSFLIVLLFHLPNLPNTSSDIRVLFSSLYVIYLMWVSKCVCAHTHAHTCMSMRHMEVRELLEGFGSLLPLCGFQDLNSRPQLGGKCI